MNITNSEQITETLARDFVLGCFGEQDADLQLILTEFMWFLALYTEEGARGRRTDN